MPFLLMSVAQLEAALIIGMRCNMSLTFMLTKLNITINGILQLIKLLKNKCNNKSSPNLEKEEPLLK